MEKYDHLKIEKKWQERWDKEGCYAAKDDSDKKKFYGLIEFPYPSGEGLHVGHIRSNTAMDIIARKRRAEGYDVLYPIGYDSFGLPTENFAIKTGIHPAEVTKQNTGKFREQLKSLGYSFDWSREIDTSNPEYYKWTQWIFLQLFKKGLAYKKMMTINWCPKDKIGLANEEVIDGLCERCGTVVEKREKDQWMLAITKYADRLDKDLDDVDYLEKIKIQQRNWIGRSEGSEIKFPITNYQFPNKSQESNSKKNTGNIWPKKILIGTRNEAKVKMFRDAFPKDFPFEVISLSDIPDIDDSDLVEGDDFKLNARLKSQFYYQKTGIPTVSTDQIQWIEKWPKDGGFVVHARKEANMETGRATDEEVGNWIEEIVHKYGESKATFHYAISFTDGRGTVDYVNVQREYILQKNKSPKTNEGYVFDRYMKDADTGEFRIEQPFHVAFSEFDQFIRHEFIRLFDLDNVDVFTTRPDTLFGATYLVLSPEHEKITDIKQQITNWQEVEEYIQISKNKTEQERTAEGKEKTGVELRGIKAINPANGEYIPVWIADYVLRHYGTGAIMAVPAHDKRDYEFAKKYNLGIRRVVEPKFVIKSGDTAYNPDYIHTGEGILHDSGIFDGMDSEEAKIKITEFTGGSVAVKYKLRDWVFSRQRYWGEPIPLVFCEEGKRRAEIPNSPPLPKKQRRAKQYPIAKEEQINPGWVAVPEEDLPVKLPDVEKYQPTDTGESPLASVPKWVNVKCPKCHGPAKRETDTMPNWAGSSWYYLAYAMRGISNFSLDKTRDKQFSTSTCSVQAISKYKDVFGHWLPVDWYNGGMEHTTLHLLYSRFWHKFLYDEGYVPTHEPYAKRTSHGLILAHDGEKMSKSKGNVVNPDDIVTLYGADSIRLYEMFMGPFDKLIAWNSDSIIGVRRFLEKVWRISGKIDGETKSDMRVQSMLNQTIKKVSEDIEQMRFNTAISAMMIFVNFADREKNISQEIYEKFIQILAPFAPHISEEIWQMMGNNGYIHESEWPKYDEELVKDKDKKIAVQVNGKARAEIMVSETMDEKDIESAALKNEQVGKWIKGRKVKKVIVVKGRIVNIVLES